MRLIEPTSEKGKDGQFRKYLDIAAKWFRTSKPGEHYEENAITQFLRGLDNRFVMLRNLQLESSRASFPPIVIGPPGIAILNVSNDKGFFKAKEDSWWKMDKTTHRFNPARPNLIKQSQEYAKKLATILDVHGKSHPDITPVLIFANPGVHLETTNPDIRIVLMDGIESLITTFQNNEVVLNPSQVNSLSEALRVIANPERAIPAGEGEDFFGRDLIVPEKKAPPKMPSLPAEMRLPDVEGKLQFTSKQWAILAVLLVLTIAVLIVAILYVLSIF